MIEGKKIKITKKDYLTFKYFAMVYDYTGLAAIIGISLLSIVVLWDYFMTQRNMLIAVICIFMLCSYIKNIFFDLPRVTKEEYAAKSFSNSNCILSVSDETITVTRNTSTPSVIRLDSLYSAFETYYQFCFFISKNNYLILPKNILSAEEKKFVHSVIKKLPRKNRRNPFSVGIKAAIRNLLMLAFITACALIMIFAYKVT